MIELFRQYVVPHGNFWFAVILMMIGLYAMITKNNLIKKLIGMSIFQTAIILFYISIGVKEGAQIPIIRHHAPEPGAAAHHETINPDEYSNPLPHVLMLTAIVVGVATLGVALAVAQIIYKNSGTLEEDELLAKLEATKGDV
jgi:multicomponent Na+:H+ antiporter subunit C